MSLHTDNYWLGLNKLINVKLRGKINYEVKKSC